MKQIVVGMSGGVDSTVAVYLLQQAGYTVSGVMLRLWKAGGVITQSEKQHEEFAAAAARQMGIAFEIVDVRQRFREKVVDYFIRSYEGGVTPNPCFFCNRLLKFDTLIEYADSHGIPWVSSGHYARIQQTDGTSRLMRGFDPEKDQSYMLASLRSDQIQRLVLPLGELTKSEVREIAKSQGFQASESKESQDVCFLPEGNYAQFLKEQGSNVGRPGDIVTREGEVIGQHQGLAFYTIGQRKGLGIYAPEPSYVLEKEIETNRLVVGKKHELGRKTMWVEDVYWHQTSVAKEFSSSVEIRYHSRPAQGVVTLYGDRQAQVVFAKAMRDITPGQAAVFYNGDEVIGSGIIATMRKG